MCSAPRSLGREGGVQELFAMVTGWHRALIRACHQCVYEQKLTLLIYFGLKINVNGARMSAAYGDPVLQGPRWAAVWDLWQCYSEWLAGLLESL